MGVSGGLYIIRLSDTHYYGGRAKSFRRRWSAHLATLRGGSHRNARMQAVYNRYGRFEPEIISEIMTIAEMISAEQAWLDQHVGHPGCLNLDVSAEGPFGRVPSPETRAKISASLMGVRHSDLRRLRNRMGQLGRVLPFATRVKIGNAQRGRKHTDETRLRMKVSASTRKKRGFVPSSRKGADLSLEMRAKMATGQAERRRREQSNGLPHCNRGKVWMTHPETGRKLVRVEDVEQYLRDGWVRGRRIR